MLVLQKSKAILPEIRPTQSGMKFDLLYLYTTHIIENSFTRLQNYLRATVYNIAKRFVT